MSLGLTSESASEFTSARQHAFIEEWLSRFTGRHADLLSFEEVKQNLRLQDASYKGLQEIELEKVVGSVGRYRDFTRSFLPKSDEMAERWRRVDAAVHDMGVPPIDVYKVGDVYFVRDGNHRVSIAKMHDAKTIEAYVTEYATTVPINKDDDPDDILLKMERTRFLQRTQLDQIRPGNNVVLTEPGRYRQIREHISFHKHIKEMECTCEIPYPEAVASWYDNVYLPVVQMIREKHVMRNFPDRTEADLYAWLMKHRAELEQHVGTLGVVNDEELIESVRRERVTNPFARLMGFFRGQMDLKQLPLKVERDAFFEQTGLNEIRPGNDISFTEPGCYQLAKKHIDVHKYLRETDANNAIPYPEAVASWYDNVYLPVAQLIRERNLLKHFPKNTEADLYLWLVSRREDMEEENQAMGQIPTEKVIWDLENELANTPILSLAQFFGQRLDLKSVVNGNH